MDWRTFAPFYHSPFCMRLALFDLKQTVDYKLEILSGLTVAMALIPEAVAFALIAGLAPLTGLYAEFFVVSSFLTGLL